MTLSDFEIDTTAVTVNVESLGTPLLPPRSTFTEFSQDVDLASGGVRGGGWIAATWTWDFMSQAQYTQLLVFCPGKSADIYIKTKDDHEAFAIYSCTMVRPSAPERGDGTIRDLTIHFRNLVLVP